MTALAALCAGAFLSISFSTIGMDAMDNDSTGRNDVRMRGEAAGSTVNMGAVRDLHVEQAIEEKMSLTPNSPSSPDAASMSAGALMVETEPDSEPVVEEWFVRQQGGQCVVGSDDGSGPSIQQCQIIPEGRPGPSEESPAPDPEESEDGEESEPEPVFITVTASEFAELPFEAPTVNLQPDRGWVLVNMDTVVYADGAPQVLTTELLGVPVAVRATPVEFAWDFGDGAAPVVTTSGGQPWPNQTIAHAYTAAAQEQVVTLTTTWSGEFQVAGQGPWIPIAGTVTTTSQSSPFAVEPRHSHLVGAQGN